MCEVTWYSSLIYQKILSIIKNVNDIYILQSLLKKHNFGEKKCNVLIEVLNFLVEKPMYTHALLNSLVPLLELLAYVIVLCNVACAIFMDIIFFIYWHFFFLNCILVGFWAKHFLSKEKPNSIILQLATIDKIVFNINRKIVFCVTCLMQLYTCHMQLENNFIQQFLVA